MWVPRHFLLPLLPPREERAGEGASLLADRLECQQWDPPLHGPLPVRSSRGEGVPAALRLRSSIFDIRSSPQDVRLSSYARLPRHFAALALEVRGPLQSGLFAGQSEREFAWRQIRG